MAILLKYLPEILAVLFVVSVLGYTYYKGGQHKELVIERANTKVTKEVIHAKSKVRNSATDLHTVSERLQRGTY